MIGGLWYEGALVISIDRGELDFTGGGGLFLGARARVQVGKGVGAILCGCLNWFGCLSGITYCAPFICPLTQWLNVLLSVIIHFV